jgi:hypothetical protein
MSEYNNSSTAPSCAYSSLGDYSQNYSMGVPNQGKVITGKYIVPVFNAISYDSLTSKIPNCSGYNNINSAYGGGQNCQTTYRTSLCGNR